MPLPWTLLPPPPPPAPSTEPRWELLSAPVLPVQAEPPAPLRQPLTAEEVDVVVNSIPLQPSDYRPLLQLSPSVPTAALLPPEQWRMTGSILSPFSSASGTGNQNYALRLDVGLGERLQLSGFYSEADDPLNADLKGFDKQPANLWESYGAAARWQLHKSNAWQIALNGSLESWTVGSGGDDSLANNKGDKASPNIFNNSGQRVTTNNLVGSMGVPVTWKASKQWQFTVSPGISFLPPSQGAGQGGAGRFYGTTPFLSGGVQWQPTSQLHVIASITQPIGTGSNSFDSALRFSRVPIVAAGLHWDLNPRIGLRGLVTNGFGATPATGLLALPSDNRLGYAASLIFTADAPDTPQPPLTARQRSLSLGGLSVNTALVPPDDTTVWAANSDTDGNMAAFIGYSLSNIFQFELTQNSTNNVPQTTPQARTYLNNGSQNWRGGGKAVLFSPLRKAPLWGALRISLGRNTDLNNATGQGYLFAETPLTWEATPSLALTMSPKVAWSGVGSLGGVGLSANVQLAPRWELLPEANVVMSDIARSNGSLGLRWRTNDHLTVEAYASSAASMQDVGQLLSAQRIRWGSRIILSF